MQGGEGVILDGDAKIPHASESKSQDTKQKQYYNKFTKKMIYIKKNENFSEESSISMCISALTP